MPTVFVIGAIRGLGASLVKKYARDSKNIAFATSRSADAPKSRFMRAEKTKGVGFDKFWDDDGAVTPDEVATSLVYFIKKFDLRSTGEYWAPRGPRDIGTAETVMGKGLPTPLQLPW